MIEISIANFKTLTGTDLNHFTQHILRGDAWGTFLKIASLIEAAAKRAVGIKLGINPGSDGVGRIEFYTALVLCKESELITNEAFEFANYVRHVRNDLVHKGVMLDLDIEQLRGTSFFKKYNDRIESFVSIQGTKITDGKQAHLNTLLMGCVAFISLLSKVLFDDDWIEGGRDSMKRGDEGA